MIIATGLDMVYPQITQRIVDEVITGGKMELLTGLLVGIVAVGIGRCIFGYCKEFSFDVLSSKIGAQIRKDLFRHIQTLSMNYFDNTNTGELMARVKDDVDKIWNAMGYVGMLTIEPKENTVPQASVMVPRRVAGVFLMPPAPTVCSTP